MIGMREGRIAYRFFDSKYAEGKNGFTLFELLIVIIVAGILAAVLLERLQAYRQYAEKTAMDMTVMNMRSGLRWQIAELMTEDRMREVGKLLDENPIRWLDRPPPNYLGVLNDVKSEDISPGNWYFDATRRELVYVPYRNMVFDAGFGGKKMMIFRVTAKTVHKTVGNSSRVEGVALTTIDH